MSSKKKYSYPVNVYQVRLNKDNPAHGQLNQLIIEWKAKNPMLTTSNLLRLAIEQYLSKSKNA